MESNIITALISAGGSVLVAVTALVLNYRGFASLDTRLLALKNRVDARLNLLRSDMKDLNKTMAALGVNVALLKDRARFS